MRAGRWVLPGTAGRSVASWLLLLFVALGVAGMHTVGHAGIHLSPSSCVGMADGDGSWASTAVEIGGGATAGATGASCACLDTCTTASGMCLAVLTVGGLLLLIAALAVATGQWLHAPVSPWRDAEPEGRSRPPQVPIGLVLADLSVLRR